ncbi:hypothetical protein [Naumannella huperziae]
MPAKLLTATQWLGIACIGFWWAGLSGSFAVVGLRPERFELMVPLGLLVIWNCIYLIVAVLVIVHAITLARRGDLAALQPVIVPIKVFGIPFFVLNFLIMFLISVAGLRFVIGVIYIPFLILGTYLVMLPTSAYGIAALVLMRRCGQIDRGFMIGHLLAHLLFVIDIVSAFIVARKARQVLDGVPRRIGSRRGRHRSRGGGLPDGSVPGTGGLGRRATRLAPTADPRSPGAERAAGERGAGAGGRTQ